LVAERIEASIKSSAVPSNQVVRTRAPGQ
jgi:hypothetical protein